MKPSPETRTCAHCHKRFIPDYRNRHHQKYCAKPACRRASKHTSQALWLAKNPDFFKGAEHVFRVQVWRREKGRGRGRMIYKLVLELMIFRRKGRQDRIQVTRKDGQGMVLQDFCELKRIIATRVFMRLVRVLQDFTALLIRESYSFGKKGKKGPEGGRSRWARKTSGGRVC